MAANRQVLEIWGDLACFTRPELKVERFSYPCITPSAARGVFEAIYAKPVEFRWQIRRIELLEKPAFLALRRNEVKEKINVTAVAAWMEGKREPEPIWADGDRELVGTDEKGRTQRQTMALRDVRYRLTAEIVPWPGHEGKQAGLEAQFRRRAEKGKCFYQPYLGCREFPAFFELISTDAEASKLPVELDLEVGLMLYDVFDLSRPGTSGDRPAVSLFRAAIRGGVLEVPEWGSAEVLRSGGAG